MQGDVLLEFLFNVTVYFIFGIEFDESVFYCRWIDFFAIFI